MNSIFLTAGIVTIIGFVAMASGQALYMANSDDYWDNVPTMPYERWAVEAKQQDMYTTISNIGLMIMGLGLAIVAFGLAKERRPQIQFREVPSHIPMQDYPQPPQPPQSP
jgi:hypothetical protein